MGNHGNKGILIELVVYGVYIAQAFPFFCGVKKKKKKRILEGTLSPFTQTGGCFCANEPQTNPQPHKCLFRFKAYVFALSVTSLGAAAAYTSEPAWL